MCLSNFRNSIHVAYSGSRPESPSSLPERLHQGSQIASPAREMRRRARPRSKCASVATAARLGRVARSSAWPAAVMRTRGDAERRGWMHGTRRAFTGDRFRESDVPAMPKLEPRRSVRALPAERLTCHAWHVAGRRAGSMCPLAPIICAIDPHFFSASNFHELGAW